MSGQVTLFDVLTNPALMTQGGLGKLIQSEIIVKVDSSTLFLRFIDHKIMVYILSFFTRLTCFFSIFFNRKSSKYFRFTIYHSDF